MRQLFRAVLLAVAFAVVAAPAAEGRAVVTPAHTIAGVTPGELLLESWTQLLALPATDNPIIGHCEALAGGRVAASIAGFEGVDVHCTIREGTPLFVRIGSFCSSIDEPPVFSHAAQVACARADASDFTAVRITVDGGTTVDMHRPRFEIISPQGTVQLPPDNLLGVDPQRISLSAVAWGVFVHNLRPGRHHTVFEFAFLDAGTEVRESILSTIDVVRH